MIIYKVFQKKIEIFFDNKIITLLLKNSFLLASFFTLVTILLCYYNNDCLKLFNKLFSGRYTNYFIFIKEIGISMLGRNTPICIKDAFLDNMYMKLLINFGIVQYGFYSMIVFLSQCKAIKEKNYFLSMLIFLVCIEGITEPNMIMPTINIFILYFASDYFEKKLIHNNLCKNN